MMSSVFHDGGLATRGLHSLQSALVFTLLIILAGLSVDYLNMLRKRRTLPPGPFPLPIIGNVMALPKEKCWISFEEWSKVYNSPILTIWVGRVPYIVVNDAWTASDLLDKRSNIYSSRPKFVVLGDMLMNTDTNPVMQVYGDRWRIHRKLTVGFSIYFSELIGLIMI